MLPFSEAINCQMGPGRNPSKMNQYENGFHFHCALFFYDCHTFPIKIMLLSQTILTKLFLFYSQETMFKKP